MCFRPASTTVGARICKSCFNVIDDVDATECPHCGNPLEASFANKEKAPESESTIPQAAPKAPSSPKTPPASKD